MKNPMNSKRAGQPQSRANKQKSAPIAEISYIVVNST